MIVWRGNDLIEVTVDVEVAATPFFSVSVAIKYSPVSN